MLSVKVEIALLVIQHFINKHLDNPDCEAVWVLAMDFSKAFDSVRHELSVYGACDTEINVLQQFLDRCYKLSFISTQLNIKSLLQKPDKVIFKKVKQCDNHPLKVCLPQEKNNF